MTQQGKIPKRDDCITGTGGGQMKRYWPDAAMGLTATKGRLSGTVCVALIRPKPWAVIAIDLCTEDQIVSKPGTLRSAAVEALQPPAIPGMADRLQAANERFDHFVLDAMRHFKVGRPRSVSGQQSVPKVNPSA